MVVGVSESTLALIRRFEGLRLAAYQDSAGVWTIGYGTTQYRNGDKVRPGDRITEDEADAILREQLAECANAVRLLVKVPLSPQQFDSLVSWTYNLGAGALRESTLLKRLNTGDYAGAANEMLRWVNAGGRPIEGLRRRREAERALFLSGVQPPAEAPASPAQAPVPQPAPEQTPEPAPQPLPSKPMAPVLAALLPSLIGMIPDLAKLFGSGTAVSNRNIAAAEKVASVVVEATQAANLQDAVERMSSDPSARTQAAEAVQARWYELAEAGGGGIDGARKFNLAAAGIPAWRMPAVWVTVALLLPVYAVVGAVLWGQGWSNEIRLQVVTAVLVVISVVSAYWLGSSSGSARKTDIIADK